MQITFANCFAPSSRSRRYHEHDADGENRPVRAAGSADRETSADQHPIERSQICAANVVGDRSVGSCCLPGLDGAPPSTQRLFECSVYAAYLVVRKLMKPAHAAPYPGVGTDGSSRVPRALQGQPAYAAETLYEGNKSYAEELEALIAARNAKLPDLKDAPPVVSRAPSKFGLRLPSAVSRPAGDMICLLTTCSRRQQERRRPCR